MQLLPKPTNLRHATEEVIRISEVNKYYPNRFRPMVRKTPDEQLLEKLSKFIKRKANQKHVEKQFKNFPNLVALEDFVAVYGVELGFDSDVIEIAKDRVKTYDKIANKQRYYVE